MWKYCYHDCYNFWFLIDILHLGDSSIEKCQFVYKIILDHMKMLHSLGSNPSIGNRIYGWVIENYKKICFMLNLPLKGIPLTVNWGSYENHLWVFLFYLEGIVFAPHACRLQILEKTWFVSNFQIPLCDIRVSLPT